MTNLINKIMKQDELTLLFIISGIVIFHQCFILIANGFFISKNIYDKYMKLTVDDIWIHSEHSTILMTRYGTFIGIIYLSIFSKYSIDGRGTVPRWSKLHKKIETYYETLNS